eukprot:COSAG01_NODE_3417_length_6121_cov_33.897376_3_plen_998_part_00
MLKAGGGHEEEEPGEEEEAAAAAAEEEEEEVVVVQPKLTGARGSSKRPRSQTDDADEHGGSYGARSHKRPAAAAAVAATASSNEESSGEESSGEEEEGVPISASPETNRSSSPAKVQQLSAAALREQYEAEMKAARAHNAVHAARREAELRARVAQMDAQIAQMTERRTQFLLDQADVFGKFLGGLEGGPSPDVASALVTAAKGKAEQEQVTKEEGLNKISGAAADADERGGKSVAAAAAADETLGKRRLTEREEDEMQMRAAQAEEEHVEETIPRLTSAQTATFISSHKMRHYQVEGLNWLIRLYHRGLNGILADEMGLGKTLQSISVLAFLHKFKGITGPHLVVVPKSTLGNWCNEFTRWYPAFRVLKFAGTKEERALIRERDLHFGEFDVCALSYETAIKEKSSLVKFPWEYLVIDEAHRIKNENSVLSQIIRLYKTKCRLLITGTPLQNNLHELWALLNYILPDVFTSSEMFEQIADAVGDEKQEVISQLHRVLRPFLLRRLKADVERGIPSKKELVVYCKLTPEQIVTYKAVLKNNVDILNGGASNAGRTKLLNTVMQLRKACCHPYLFDGVEDKTLDPFGEHLVTHSGKLVLLDKLLPRLQRKGSRVLIFSQMTRVLDILEDYCTMRKHKYCRMDGSTNGDLRDAMVDEFNSEGSETFIFLLSTRAGGLGINLATADVVVLYDSDWNPQMDLQAQDRAHRIGQKKPVKVFRLITEGTIEEKILDRAMKKLHLDALVIQSGRLVDKEQKLGTGELLTAIRAGADSIFKTETNGAKFADEDIDEILVRAEQKTKAMKKKFAIAKKEGLSSDMWTFDGEDYKEERKVQSGSLGFVDIGKRDRKTTTYSENDMFNDLMGTAGGGSGPRKAKDITFNDFHFFDEQALRPLLLKERGIKRVTGPDGIERIEQVERQKLTEAEKELKQELLDEGFASWGKRDFLNFVRANADHGWQAIAEIAAEMDGKSVTEVRRYAAVFWERGPDELADWDKHVARM